MAPTVAYRAYVDRAAARIVVTGAPQNFLPELHEGVTIDRGTEANVDESSADGARNEIIFERVIPSCYLGGAFPALLERSSIACLAPNEKPAEDMHRAILKISQILAEICEAKRINASTPRGLDHDIAADGMSAGG